MQHTDRNHGTTGEWEMVELETVKAARQHLEKDHALALFMVRDLQVTKDMELSDLVWSMHRNGCVRSEVKWLLDELEARLEDGRW